MPDRKWILFINHEHFRASVLVDYPSLILGDVAALYPFEEVYLVY